ncbi:hypothetical protein Golob_024819 [Gossypium lobatum]|uniref:SPX domain-containing protein n=1 Tax=Gossypium lobatum TaxID=34289 RepID=A0A7J8NGV0_9ROSI|nr:hypothetical protein [Gossypium lobatum]
MLNNEIDKFNAFFMEQEEDFIIRHKELQERIKRVMDKWSSNGSRTEYNDEMAKIRKDVVDFHGEMVLLENYSNINFTGTFTFKTKTIRCIYLGMKYKTHFEFKSYFNPNSNGLKLN